MEAAVKVWLLCMAIALHAKTSHSDLNVIPAHCPHLNKLEALPGPGWDSIRNKEMGRVLAFTYDQCRTTEDGKYLIPDGVYVVAVKDGTLQTTSEFIAHYLNYTSVISASLKINVGFNIFGLIGVQSSFDTSYLDAKNRQVNEKSKTTRIQARIVMYIVQSMPDSKIDPALKSLFEQVINATESNNEEKAKLLCQFIVRDYGTHYIYQVDAGAVLLEEDYISSSFLAREDVDELAIKQAAGASFFKKIAGEKFSFSVSQAFQESYESNKTSSSIRSIGGALVSANMTVDDWIKEIPNNLVVIDRSGNPLSFLLNPERFPTVAAKTLNAVRKLLDGEIKHYYAYNTHFGCTDVNSVNFDYNANVDSNDCQAPSNAYSFGAGYMTCTSHSTELGDLCEDLNTKNPFSGEFRCEDEYVAVPLTNGTLNKQVTNHVCWQECSGWWFWKRCWQECKDVVKTSRSEYKGFWCMSKSPPRNGTGVMFGGVFTSWMNNPLTRDRSCPMAFTALRLAPDLQVCVSKTYDIGFQYSAAFGGFFSCRSGNPLTTRLVLAVGNGDGYLHACPKGFSQRMAVIDNGCEINYCVKLAAVVKQIDIVLPPFGDQEALYVDTTVFKPLVDADAVDGPTVSAGAVAGIVCGVFVVLVAVVVGVVVARRRRRGRVAEAGQEGLLPQNEGYGAIG